MRVLALKSDNYGTQLPAPKNTAHPVNQQYVVGTPRITKQAVAEPGVGVAKKKEDTHAFLTRQIATMRTLQESAQAVAQMRIAETSALIDRAELFGQQAEPVRKALIPINEILEKVAAGVLLTADELKTLKTAVPGLPSEPTEGESEGEETEEEEVPADNFPPLEPEPAPEPAPVGPAMFTSIVALSTLPQNGRGSGGGPNLGTVKGKEGFLFDLTPVTLTSENGHPVVGLNNAKMEVNTVGKAILLVGTVKGITARSASVEIGDITAFGDFIAAAGLENQVMNTPKFQAITTLFRSKSGHGIRKQRKPPKSAAGRADALGHLGGVKINLHMLGSGILELSDAKGKMVMHRPATSGLAHLLTHRGSMAGAGTKYTERDLHDFHEIAQMAGVNVPSHTAKARALLPGVKEAIFLPKDVPTLEARLEVLRGERSAGNASKALINEALVIADMLLKKRALSKRDHESVFREMVM